MPTLKFGIWNGRVVPLSVVTVDRNAVRASSWSLAREMLVGSDTRRNLVFFDILRDLYGYKVYQDVLKLRDLEQQMVRS